MIMDKYLFFIITLIIFSLVSILYIRISAKISKTDDSTEYDNVVKDPLSHPKSSDFTLLE